MSSGGDDSMPELDLSSNDSKGYALSGKIMLSAIVILFFIVILMVSLHLYARWYLLRARRRHYVRRARNRRTQLVFYVDPSDHNATHAAAVGAVQSRGLDATVLKSLPLFVYSAETHPELIECAVCLSEFEEKEMGRVLPKCKHSFHIECIGMWFHSHSTCPLCRSPVEAPVPENPVVEMGRPSPAELESGSGSSGLCVTCQHEGGVGGVASTSSFRERSKPVELMGVTIQVPPRRINGNFEDESATESPASQPFRSPMSRMLSFTRILSRERRAPVSPAAGCAESSSGLDVERGREQTR